ncbi:MAG: ferredoxin family protein [Methanobacteriaceae archaeon]|nr:ferredoxin family protein [Methanobacteriaceae archaeon]
MEVDTEKCIGCGNCKEICPKGGFIWTIKNKTASVSNLQYCHVCTLCAMKCGPDAIKIIRDAPDE